MDKDLLAAAIEIQKNLHRFEGLQALKALTTPEALRAYREASEGAKHPSEVLRAYGPALKALQGLKG